MKNVDIMNENILEELWNSRHPHNVLFLKLINGYQIDIKPNLYIYKTTYNIFHYYPNDNIICIHTRILHSFCDEFDLYMNQVKILMKELLLLNNFPFINSYTKIYKLHSSTQ